MSCQIGQYCRSFHDCQAVLVVVYKHRYSAIGPESCEPRLFLDVLADVDSLVCVVRPAIGFLQFFEHDLGFVAWIYLSAASIEGPV